MNLSLNNLNCKKEKVYFAILLMLAFGAWVGVPYWLFFSKMQVMVWTYIGISLLFAFFAWLGNGLIVAYLRANCVKINDLQFPNLHIALEEVCQRLNVCVPELYVLQSHGFLNAFAMRHSGRDFVVLYSKFIEELDLAGDEVRFILGHEMGHLKSKHISKQILLMPSAWLPLIGPAYHRACETSCDRYGAFVAGNIDGAIKALAILASGKKLMVEMNLVSFAEQHQKIRGFFISWHELISNYPTLSQRVGAMMAIKDGLPQKRGFRNPLSYFFALFSFGGSSHGTTPFIAIAIFALLSAIAIPNLLRAKISANDALAKATVKAISTAAVTYAQVHNGKYPNSEADLNKANPPFLNNSYCQKTIAGFMYSCKFTESSYEIVATPVTLGTTGSSAFSAQSSINAEVPDSKPKVKEINPANKKILEELGLSSDDSFGMDFSKK